MSDAERGAGTGPLGRPGPAARGLNYGLGSIGVWLIIGGAVAIWRAWEPLQFERLMAGSATYAGQAWPYQLAAGGAGACLLGVVLVLFGIVDVRLQQIRDAARRD